jgi:tetratricopeptide (TPR) repeat protein
VFTEREKLKGNEFYRVGEVEEAVKCYSRSIDLDPKNHILYANRAMGYLKLEAYEKAEEDCSKALAIDCTYVKAWSRRGLTRFKRGQYAAVIIQLFKLLYYPIFFLFLFSFLLSKCIVVFFLIFSFYFFICAASLTSYLFSFSALVCN